MRTIRGISILFIILTAISTWAADDWTYVPDENHSPPDEMQKEEIIEENPEPENEIYDPQVDPSTDPRFQQYDKESDKIKK